MARLFVTNANGETRSIPLSSDETVLGRSPDVTVVLEGDGVSRRHAVIRRNGDGHEVEDLGSKNGTLVNGERLSAARILAPGDRLELPGWSLVIQEDETVTVEAAPGQPLRPAGAKTVELRPETREVVVRGNVVQLAPKEYLALTLLYERAGRIVTKEELAEHVWPEYKGDVSDYNIHQVVSRLRRELEADPAHPRVLITRPGFGYLLSP